MSVPFVNVGEVIAGKFRVDRILGVGGMGMVLAVTHLELEQRMALKLMRTDAATSASARERFLREARAAVKLRGEHVCRVFDTGKLDNGDPYIAMELLEGEDFSRLLSKRAPLPVADTVDYMLQAIEGVAEAHANGIIHRDLKPGNLFVAVDNDGSPLVKVLDFGISKSSSVAGGITQTGDVMGSPSYMAPEHMESAKDVDVRADIWALGVILYQATSRRLPFEQETLPALCAALVTEDPTPLAQLAKVPLEFSSVVMRCLEKKRDDRPADVGELATLLAPFGGSSAKDAATRIGRVLRRQKPPSKAPEAFQKTHDPNVATQATIDPNAATQATADVPARPAVPLAGQVSTFQAGSAQSLGSSVPPTSRRRAGVLVGIGALAVAGVTVAIVSMQSRDVSNSSRQPAAGSAPVDPEPAQSPTPTPTPSPPPPEEPPPVPPVGSGTGAQPPQPAPPKPKVVRPAVVGRDAGVDAPAATPHTVVGPDGGIIFKGTRVPVDTNYPGK